MHFEKGQLYHIYNQGNNRQKIFFERENYLFFLKKIRMHILPFCDVLAYCLMPNHFHIMGRVNEVSVDHSSDDSKSSDELKKQRTLNQSVAIMLSSYTRAINKQKGSTGSLFRPKTKAECLTQTNGITLSFYNTNTGTQIHIDNPEEQYSHVCFSYIHQNPVRAGLVKSEVEWEFSSAQDFARLRNGTLVNRGLVKEYIEF